MNTKYRNLPQRFKDLKSNTGFYLAGISVFSAALIVFLSVAKSGQSDGFGQKKAIRTLSAAKCEAVDWAVWKSFENKSASGTIVSQGKNIGVTITSDDDFKSTPQIEHYSAFKRFDYTAPNSLVPRTTWSKQPSGVTTICFSEAVKDPVMLLASLGSVDVLVKTTLNFSEAYVMMFNVAGMRIDNNKSLTGKEGYAILKFPGLVKCIMIKSTNNDDFTDITMGISACAEGIKNPDPVVIAAVADPILPKPTPIVAVAKPKPAPEPIVETPKAALVVPVVKPEPAIKPVVETTKPSLIVPAVTKPEPIIKSVIEAPKPTPAVAVKAELAAKLVNEVPKPSPVITIIPKPELAPKLVVEAPNPAPVIAVIKPEPAPKPIIETPNPAPVIAVIKPELASKPVVETPKPAPVIAAIKPELASNPVVEAAKPSPVGALVKVTSAPKPPSETTKSAPPIFKSEAAPVAKAKVISLVNGAPKPARPIVITPKPNESVRNKLVKIQIWDYSGLDHDSISLKLNGKQIGPKAVELPAYNRYGSPQFTYEMELGDGENILEIYAVSSGLEGSTTVGMLIIYEDRRKKSSIALKNKETGYVPL